MKISAVIDRLREDIAFRRTESGFALLRRHEALVDSLAPGMPMAGTLLGFVAQWVDIGYAALGGTGLDLLRKLTARFPPAARGTLPLADYAHLRMALGLVAATDEGPDTAIQHFQFVLS